MYALASTCYYALTGVMIPDAMDRLGNRTYTPLYQLRPEIPREISQAVDLALKLDYRERTASAQEFIQGLTQSSQVVVSRELPGKRKGRPYMEILTGSHAGVRWSLPVNTQVSIGRSVRLSNIVISGDLSISKEHCRLRYDEERNEFLLTDVSKNGVYVQNQRLMPNQQYRYTPNQQISLASSMCTILLGVADE